MHKDTKKKDEQETFPFILTYLSVTLKITYSRYP